MSGREEFESWFRLSGYNTQGEDDFLWSELSEQYTEAWVECAWQAWRDSRKQKNYTQGPWSVEKDIHGALHVVAGEFTDIAEVGICPGYDPEANARLLAAAPDLLGALQMLETTCGDGLEIDHPIRVYARSVIKKATTIQ